jgi:hypothetical protein
MLLPCPFEPFLSSSDSFLTAGGFNLIDAVGLLLSQAGWKEAMT